MTQYGSLVAHHSPFSSFALLAARGSSSLLSLIVPTHGGRLMYVRDYLSQIKFCKLTDGSFVQTVKNFAFRDL